MLTFAPCSASAMAAAAPIPLRFDEPVTMAVLPFRTPLLVILSCFGERSMVTGKTLANDVCVVKYQVKCRRPRHTLICNTNVAWCLPIPPLDLPADVLHSQLNE